MSHSQGSFSRSQGESVIEMEAKALNVLIEPLKLGVLRHEPQTCNTRFSVLASSILCS